MPVDESEKGSHHRRPQLTDVVRHVRRLGQAAREPGPKGLGRRRDVGCLTSEMIGFDPTVTRWLSKGLLGRAKPSFKKLDGGDSINHLSDPPFQPLASSAHPDTRLTKTATASAASSPRAFKVSREPH